ncbi:MAG: sensor histidine kinase [Sphingobium sp.]|nr:sensor histidine kinase [Sphingobium sp.]MCP5399686.1 sensor histidine kinase [Sphingomonas sp.]
MTSTAAKVFFIMMLALLPLAVIATISNLQSIRSSDRQKREILNTATEQNARQLASDIDSIRAAQTMTANVLATESDPGNICERLLTLFRTIGNHDGIVSSLSRADGTILCASGGGEILAAGQGTGQGNVNEVELSLELGGIVIHDRSRDGSVRAMALYKNAAMPQLTHASSQSVVLEDGKRQLVIAGHNSSTTLGNQDFLVRAPVGQFGINLAVGVEDDTSSISKFISLVMPLILLFGAAFLGWLVVRWILIKPLIVLQREVASYSPGTVFHPSRISRFSSSELGALGGAFQEVSENVARHEDEIRQALERQTKLTREVHHRVKNNLQIISSLISLHWRAAQDPQTSECYLSIQRRVDALAVVQRHHYAEVDEQRGVSARPMLNEIASGLRTSAQIQSGSDINISVSCDILYLHQDIAAPLAFMTAELADLVIASGEDNAPFEISLTRDNSDPGKARFTLSSSVFSELKSDDSDSLELYERVLQGLARQLRSTLDHDPANKSYSVLIPVLD